MRISLWDGNCRPSGSEPLGQGRRVNLANIANDGCPDSRLNFPGLRLGFNPSISSRGSCEGKHSLYGAHMIEPTGNGQLETKPGQLCHSNRERQPHGGSAKPGAPPFSLTAISRRARKSPECWCRAARGWSRRAQAQVHAQDPKSSTGFPMAVMSAIGSVFPSARQTRYSHRAVPFVAPKTDALAARRPLGITRLDVPGQILPGVQVHIEELQPHVSRT